MDDDELHGLVQETSDALEVYGLRQFKVLRATLRDGGHRELLVTILDAGPEEGDQRYSVEVEDSQPTNEADPPRSSSNQEGTIRDALRGVHWNEFDRPIQPGSDQH